MKTQPHHVFSSRCNWQWVPVLPTQQQWRLWWNFFGITGTPLETKIEQVPWLCVAEAPPLIPPITHSYPLFSPALFMYMEAEWSLDKARALWFARISAVGSELVD